LSALTPARVLDTRSGTGFTGAVAPGGIVHLKVDGQGHVPGSGVAPVVLNVTVTQPKAAGFLTVYGDGPSRPPASNPNFLAGQTVVNLVVAPVSADGKVAFYNGSAVSVQIVADVSGSFSAN
jgi:hypothetical protein